MGRGGDTQVDFYPLARALAQRGYLALTYNRCVGRRRPRSTQSAYEP
jgi:hypothetical protein